MGITDSGHAALRRGRASLPGQAYLVTFVTWRRRPLFRDRELGTCAARAATDARLWANSRLLAWVLMPDHWHGLLQLGDGDDLSRRVCLLKANIARQVRVLRPDIGPVWAAGFHDSAIRDEARMVHYARYVVLNPVRAGVVARVGDWPFWDAVWL